MPGIEKDKICPVNLFFIYCTMYLDREKYVSSRLVLQIMIVLRCSAMLREIGKIELFQGYSADKVKLNSPINFTQQFIKFNIQLKKIVLVGI